MPQNKNSQPPKVMTWSKALPILLLSLVFDALRFMFNMFWFFGPAIAALYCTLKASDYVGTTVGGLLCGAGAGVVGFLGAAPIAAFGVIMAMAVGFLGWMTVGLLLIISNARLFTDHPGHSIWFVASLATSEIPFVGALPALTGTLAKLYHTQIKNDKEAFAAYEKSHAEEQRAQQQQQIAELTQTRAIQEAQQQAADNEQYAEEEAANEERYEQTA